MQLDSLKVPFRWYSNALLSTRFDDACRQYRYKLITPADRLLPFLFRFSETPEVSLPKYWRIYSGSGALAANLSSSLNLIDFYSLDGWFYIVYRGASKIENLALANDFYYSTIELEDGTLFTSEEFWVDCDEYGRTISADFNDDFNEDFATEFTTSYLNGLKKYTKIMWWNNCDIHNLLYQTGYKNILYIDSDLIRDKPEIIEEGSEDGAKDFVPSFIKYIDRVLMADYVPDYVLNALLAIPLHSDVLATTKDNLYVGRAKRFECSFDIDNSCFSRVELKFQQETQLLKSECCGNNALVDLYSCSAIIGGLVHSVTGGTNVHIEWQLLQGAPTDYEIVIPGSFNDAPQITSNLSFDFVSNGVAQNVSVRPRCVFSNGRIAYGNVLSLIIGG